MYGMQLEILSNPGYLKAGRIAFGERATKTLATVSAVKFRFISH